jgi:hypothetical protein
MIAKNSRHPEQCPNTIETPLSGVAERGMQTRYVQAKAMPKRSHWSAEHEQKLSKERSSGNVRPWLRLGRNCRRLATKEAHEFMKWIISKLWGARSRLYRHRALDEIYKMFIVFHRSDLRISVKIVHLVVAIFIIPYFYFDGVCHCFIALHVHECVSEFRGYFQKMKKVMENVCRCFANFCGYFLKCPDRSKLFIFEVINSFASLITTDNRTQSTKMS